MDLSNLAGNVKLAMLLMSVIKSPEDTVLKILDDFGDTGNPGVQRLKDGVCTKVGCDNIIIEPGDECVYISFCNVKTSSTNFVTNVMYYVIGIANKLLPVVSMFVPDLDIKSTLYEITIVDDTVNGKFYIEIPTKGEVMKLNISEDPENNVVIIEVPVKSEKILEKLKEKKERET